MIGKPHRVVIDTNIFLSAILNPSSLPSRAVEEALRSAQVLRSMDTWGELEDVLQREKFDRYRSVFARRRYFEYLTDIVEEISVLTQVAVCRDPRDDKYLALAIDGRADAIISGDFDLLALHPFSGINILTPLAYLAL